MKINLTPVAAVLSFWLTGPASAAGGVAGANGVSQIGVDIVDLIGAQSIGRPGGIGDPANSAATPAGENGEHIGPITIEHGSKNINGQQGVNGSSPSTYGGGGVGGIGGAAVIGGISIGGAGGYSTTTFATGGNGGGSALYISPWITFH